jgi:hypothetical protein
MSGSKATEFEGNFPDAPPPGLEQEISGYARGLLERMGFSATVDAQVVDGAYEVRIDGGDNDAILIGRRGETLEALQHVIAKMASRGREDLVRVRVDVSNYRERRGEQLEERAREMAARVRETGEEYVTEPLPAAERRIIHRTLSDVPDITTHALGEGLVKRIRIALAGNEAGAASTAEVWRPEREEVEEASPGETRSPTSAPGGTTDGPVQQPVSMIESWSGATPAAKETEQSEWGRRPKPAKGRRSR